MFPECSLNVHWMFTESSLSVDRMFLDCSLTNRWWSWQKRSASAISATRRWTSSPRPSLCSGVRNKATIIIFFDASAHILFQRWFGIWSLTHIPSCDRSPSSHFTRGAHMTVRTAKSYYWFRGYFFRFVSKDKSIFNPPPRHGWDLDLRCRQTKHSIEPLRYSSLAHKATIL